MIVKLKSRSGKEVGTIDVAKFQQIPDAVVWGAAVYVLQGPHALSSRLLMHDPRPSVYVQVRHAVGAYSVTPARRG